MSRNRDIADARADGDSFKGSPFDGYCTPEKEKLRLAVSDFVRRSGEFDGVIDFNKAVADPAKPGYIRSEFDEAITCTRTLRAMRQWQGRST